VAATPEHCELHFEDETHLETNPHLARTWHQRGQQPTVPAAGTNRRLTCFGSVAAGEQGRVEVLCASQDSAAFAAYLIALKQRQQETGKFVYLVLDNGPCHRSKVSQAA
jgi:DDE superfamily endonuclease